MSPSDQQGQGTSEPRPADPVSDSGLSLPGESSESSPPAGESAEAQSSEGEVAQEAEGLDAEAADEAEGPETPAAEAAEEVAVEEAPAAEAAENGEEAGEHHEGESVQERPDSPDDVDEAGGDDAQAGESEQD